MNVTLIHKTAIYGFTEIGGREISRDTLSGMTFDLVLRKIHDELTQKERENTFFAVVDYCILDVIFHDGKFHPATAQKARRAWRSVYKNCGFKGVPQENKRNYGKAWTHTSALKLRFTPESRTQAACELAYAIRYTDSKLGWCTRTHAEWITPPREFSVFEALRKTEISINSGRFADASIRDGKTKWSKTFRGNGCMFSAPDELTGNAFLSAPGDEHERQCIPTPPYGGWFLDGVHREEEEGGGAK